MPRGRPRKPTSLKILEGEKRPERLDLDAPRPDRGTPERPDGLGLVAAAKWDQLCETLDRMGVLTVADAEPLEQYARVYEIWRKSEAAMRHGGSRGGAFTVDGRLVKAPARLFKELTGVLIRLEVELGLTPAARTRVIGRPADETPKGKLAKYG